MSNTLLCYCGGPATTWVQTKPGTPFDYKVECSSCHCQKYPGWQAELDELSAAGVEITVRPYAAPATLDAFFT